MTRYHFHYWREGRLWVPDDDGGVELADLRAAHGYALKLNSTNPGVILG